MAEKVQHNIEEMIPELEQLERIGFFSDLQTKSVYNVKIHYRSIILKLN